MQQKSIALILSKLSVKISNELQYKLMLLHMALRGELNRIFVLDLFNKNVVCYYTGEHLN